MALEYLKKLELAARWRLPPEEAEETAADYREMLEERPEEPPENRWGNPTQAIRLIERPAQYRRWLAAFGSMAVCVFLPACWLMGQEQRPNASACLAVFGAAVSLIWFGRQGRKQRGRPPQALWALLILQLLLAGLAGGTLWLAA